MSTPNVNHPGKISPPQTGQTGQNRHTPYYEVAEDDDGQWHWVLWSGNGKMLAVNPVPYSRKKDVIQAIKVFQSNVVDAKVIVKSHKQEEK